MKPYQLIYCKGMWTLYGYETNEGYAGLKMFNLTEIKNIKIRGETFDLPEDFFLRKSRGRKLREIHRKGNVQLQNKNHGELDCGLRENIQLGARSEV